MPLTALTPIERSTLGILYQFDVALTARVAAANFTVNESDAAEVLGQLAARGFVDDLGDGLYAINERGSDAIVASGEFRGGQLVV